MEFKLKKFRQAVNVTRIANIHYFEFTKKYHTYRDKHAFRELVYVDSGFINIDAQNYCGVLEKNQIIIHKSEETHSLNCGFENAPNVIIIGFECNAPELDVFSSKPHNLTPECQRLLTDVIKEGRKVFLSPYDVPYIKDMKKRKDYQFGADQMVKLKLEAFLIELVRSLENNVFRIETQNDFKTKEIYSYISDNYAKKITLDELCFLYSTNKTTLCSSFKTVYGETIMNFINKKRIKEAKKLFRDGRYNLTQISELVGFSSIHYFSRIFKQYEGISPKEYINTIKSKLGINE